MLKTMLFILRMELLLLLRRSQHWLYSIGFFIIVMSLFPLAISPDPQVLAKLMPGAIWIAALLASLLSLEALFFTDIEDGYLEQQLLSHTPFTFILIAKLTAQWLVGELPLILLTPLLGIMFHLEGIVVSYLVISLLLGTPILILLGSLGSALTLGLRQQGVLLSLLILPLVVPVLIFGVNIVQEAEAGFSVQGPLAFLAALCVLACLFMPLAITATLRISVDE